LKTRLSCHPYVVLELVLASKKTGSVIISDPLNTKALALTGRVDYTLLTVPPDDGEDEDARCALDCKCRNFVLVIMLTFEQDDLLKRSRLDKVLESPIVSKAAGHLGVHPFEVKSFVVELTKYVAQANGEALIL
jgi:hypothetical protein